MLSETEMLTKEMSLKRHFTTIVDHPSKYIQCIYNYFTVTETFEAKYQLCIFIKFNQLIRVFMFYLLI